MKKIRIITAIVLASVFAMTSCESYFDVELDDQAKIEDLFTQSSETHKYLSHLYSFIPIDEEPVGSHGYVIPRSDEALFSWYQWVYYDLFKRGNYSPATTNFNYWSSFYIAINQCSTFLKYIDLDKEDSPTLVKYMKAEARFLRAYYYFCLFRQYGPVYVWGDQIADETILGNTVDRMTVDQNIDFIVGELETIDPDLPLTITDGGENQDQWAGRATRGAARALKSRVLLYAASPLYNGCDLYIGQMKNMRGEFLFPQTKDANKWEKAAQAAKAVIDMNQYLLCGEDDALSGTDDERFKKGAESYQKVLFENWNSETIWGWWYRTSSGYSWLGGVGGAMTCALPVITHPEDRSNRIILYGFGGIAPSLKLVDSYPMWTSGRYPIQSYEGSNDMSKPVVDEASGYKTTGFTEGYQDRLHDWVAPFKAHNSCIGRDPRFYACLVPNGFWWPNKTENIRYTNYNNPEECSCQWTAGETNGVVRVGYAWRRLYKDDLNLRLVSSYVSLKYVYPAFRMAEIYLNYAEACNEKPERDADAACSALNKVRNRVGLNNIETAYPGIANNQELLRWCIQKERMVEFGLEAMRHYDACRWMIAKDEYPMANWTLHMSATTYEESYERVSTDYIGGSAVFSDRDYLFPISSTQLAEMTNITQNYGF